MSNPPASLKEGNSEVLVNFRSLSGFKNRVYRCGRPDDLATILNAESYTWEERIFLFDLTLNVDLRSNPEVDHAKQGAWSSKAPGGAFDIVQLDDVAGKDGQDLSSLFEKKEDDSKHRRVLLRANLLDKTSKYINEHWFENNIGVSKDEDFPTYMKIVFAEVKKRGLDLFMYTSLEMQKEEYCNILKAVTLELECGNATCCAINCTQGKDRSGMACMLLQAAIGLSDEDIVDEFALSDTSKVAQQASAAMMQVFADKLQNHDNNDHHKAMAGAKPQMMKSVLSLLSTKYGSVSPGYLNDIGFDETWRNRLMKTVLTSSLQNLIL